MLDLISIVPGAEWPAIPSARASQLLALQFQLERSQWLSPDQLAIAQRGQLARVAVHAVKTVPFYRDRLDELQIALGHPIDLSDWQHLPLLTRSDLQTSAERLPTEYGRFAASWTALRVGNVRLDWSTCHDPRHHADANDVERAHS